MGDDLFATLRRDVHLPTIVQADTPLTMKLRGGREHFRGPCPLHGGRNENFLVYRSTKDDGWRFKCYSKCGVFGDVIDYLKEKRGMTLREAIESLTDAPRAQPPPVRERPASVPLNWNAVGPYQRALDLPIDPTGKDSTTGLDWWYAQGLDDPTIEHFQLGLAPHCPMAYDAARPKARHPSATIPIWSTDPLTGQRTLHNIRHRLIHPLTEGGDKYRPHALDLGLHLFNTDSLYSLPDGSSRVNGPDATCLIIGGEKKVMVCHRFGLAEYFPLLADTGGEGSWLGFWGERWVEQLEALDLFERYVVIRDPDMLDVAIETARLFGRRGFYLPLRDKVDDWLLEDPSIRPAALREMVAYARSPFF